MKRISKELFTKKMTRYEFLQFIGGSALVFLGLGNLMALLRHVEKQTDTNQSRQASQGFGSRKFGA